MKEKLADAAVFIERMIRTAFYLGAGAYLSAKAFIIIPQNPALANWLTIPASSIALVGGLLLAIKVANEPTPKQLRQAKLSEEILKKIGENVTGGND